MSAYPVMFGDIDALLPLWVPIRKKKGDERTGPALNPLKGSSARVPHIAKGAN